MSIIQRASEDGVVPEEVTLAMMVLLPKWRGKQLEIGIMKVVWMVCVAVVNC